jgi:hypothetical protein
MRTGTHLDFWVRGKRKHVSVFSKPPYLLTRIVKFWISGGDAWELISSLVNLPPFLICAGKKAVWEITFLPGSICELANSSKTRPPLPLVLGWTQWGLPVTSVHLF